MDDFRKTPLGHFTRFTFLGTAVLFALEHGPYWEVGLLAGLAYNWWMVRTKSLGDLIWCHGVTNACLSAWVLVTGDWHYW
jgi:CAAX prenyl protease-like protein